MNRHFIISTLMAIVWITAGVIGMVKGNTSMAAINTVMGAVFIVNAFRSRKNNTR